jgi:hypothetical protein
MPAHALQVVACCLAFVLAVGCTPLPPLDMQLVGTAARTLLDVHRLYNVTARRFGNSSEILGVHRALVCAPGCLPRPALRLFAPAAVRLLQPPTQQNEAADVSEDPSNLQLAVFDVVVQLADGVDARSLLSAKACCGEDYACVLTAAPPAVVLPASARYDESGSIVRISIGLQQSQLRTDAAAGGGVLTQQLQLTVPPDPCGVTALLGAVKVTVDVYKGPVRVR